MALKWTNWTTDPSADPQNESDFLTPYADWYLKFEHRAGKVPRFRNLRQRRGPEASPFPFVMHDLPLPDLALPPTAAGATALPLPRKDVIAGLNSFPASIDVIVGVIDAGLSLAHERFRRKGGIGTRILSYWQQGGNWDKQPHLPFGRELMQRDIDHLMRGAADVDEAEFNRAAKLVDFTDPMGERWIETAAPHGTHVADLAAGCDPLTDNPEISTYRDRSHLILVDLAPRISIGPAGSFLEDCAIWAVRHIVDTADAIWKELYPAEPGGGFPVVINLSYGFNAGPKAGTFALQKFVRLLNHQRADKSPIRLVMPAGNDNLSQGSAVLAGRDDARRDSASLGWRLIPEDRTSSYVEIWDDPEPMADQRHPSAPPPIWLTPPNGPSGPGTAGQPGQICDLKDENGQPVARIYCRQADTEVGVADLDKAVTGAIGYVLCAAPTWKPDGPGAPAGEWRITLGPGPLAKLHVQSDQTLFPGSGSSLLSYFEELADTHASDRYQRFNPDGNLRDTYVRNPVTGVVEDADSRGSVRRQNTMNALSGAFGILTIAGYRASDGWPAPYSGTSRGAPKGGAAIDTRAEPTNVEDSAGGKAFMDAACISDDGAWHIGRLAAGSRSGSSVVMQGTSFATAEATRIVAGILLNWIDAGRPDIAPASATGFRGLAAQHEASVQGWAYTSAISDLPRKLGFGRFPRQNHGRPERIVSVPLAP